MAQINRWKCDICGQEFGEKDAGFSNRAPVNIGIFIDRYVDDRKYIFEDACMSCRFKLAEALDQTLEKIMI